jgi:cation diffusion facilitator family transporter
MTAPEITLPPHSAAKRKAALASVAASAGLTIAKAAVGLATGSIGILGEAAHSLLDLGATLITYFAVRVSDKPPDADHPYGHGKIESVAALSETALLLLTSGVIVWEAGKRLITRDFAVEATWWSAAVMAASILVDIGRSRALARLARQASSPALEADALHFASDVLSSGVVLVGLGAVALGYKVADSVAALGVAGFVAVAAWRLGRRTIDALIDTAPEGIAERVRGIARRIAGVVDIGRVRARIAGTGLQVDLEAGINRLLSLERTGEIQREIADRIRAAFPGAEIAVSTYPLTLDDESIRERILMIAAYHGLPIHHVTVQHLDGRPQISLDLEIDARRTLGDAHDTATELELAISAEFGGEADVQTHIEPLMREESESLPASPARIAEVAAAIQQIAGETPGVIDAHDVRVREDRAGLYISFHCTFSPAETVEFVHTTASGIEDRLRRRFDAYRIVTHAEPPELPATGAVGAA